jgi:hypothetical protein
VLFLLDATFLGVILVELLVQRRALFGGWLLSSLFSGWLIFAPLVALLLSSAAVEGHYGGRMRFDRRRRFHKAL